MPEWNVGVIGAGYWGKKHVDEYVRLGAKVTVSDLKQENLDFCKQKFGVQVTKDYEQILQDKSIECVSICTPNDSHYPLAKEALRAGKRVMVEKPLCKTAVQGLDLLETAKKAGKSSDNLAVGHMFRFNNAVNKAKEMLEKGELGEVSVVKFRWANVEMGSRWTVTDRDVIYDLAPHPFDLVNYLFKGIPSEVCCVGSSFYQKEIMEAAFITAKLGKMLVSVELSWLTPPKVREMVLVGSKKTVFVQLTEQKMSVCDNQTQAMEQIEVTPSNMLGEELKAFLEGGKSKASTLADGKAGVASIKMLELCEQSHAQKKVLSLK